MLTADCFVSARRSPAGQIGTAGPIIAIERIVTIMPKRTVEFGGQRDPYGL